MNRRTSPDSDAYYHEQVTYDSKGEQWSGLLSLMLVPLFLIVVGVGFFSFFRLPSSDTGEVNGLQLGIGGGADTTVTPTKAKTAPICTPPPTVSENLIFIQ